MKRKEFIRNVGMSIFGTATLPLLAAKPLSRLNEGNYNTRYIDINTEGNWAWLAQAATTALVSTLIAKAVEWCIDGQCFCNGGSCNNNTALESAYSHNKCLYRYDDPTCKFLVQNLQDDFMPFGNASVPFLDFDCNRFTNIEGPYLAALSWAIDECIQTHKRPAHEVRSCLIPQRELSNGGYRFDIESCSPTIYTTKSGSVRMDYKPNWQGRNFSGGIVQVSARGQDGKEYWQRDYDFKMR